MSAKSSDATSTPSVAIIRAYFEAFEQKDLDTLLSLLTEDFALEIPYNFAGTNDFGNSWHGFEAARGGYRQAFEHYVVSRYSEVVYTPALDPAVVFVEALGDMTTPSGRSYNNRYMLRIELRDSKICRIREYHNPMTYSLAFR